VKEYQVSKAKKNEFQVVPNLTEGVQLLLPCILATLRLLYKSKLPNNETYVYFIELDRPTGRDDELISYPFG
jgi:hypothetical protein